MEGIAMRKLVCGKVALHLAGMAMLAVLAGCGGSPTEPPPPPPLTLTASVAVTATPCVAPASGNVNCSFSASTSGGTTPFTYAWTFSNPANGQSVQASGQ